MKKTVLRYGLYASLFIIIFFLAKWIILGSAEGPTDKKQEILGYAGMILSLLFIFPGIKYYRDRMNGGVISFGKAMKVGLLITLLPALAFGLFDIIYVLFLDPGFVDNYYNAILADMKLKLSATEYQEKAKDMESMRDMFSSPLVQFAVMAITVYLIGIVVTVISSLILKRKAVKV